MTAFLKACFRPGLHSILKESADETPVVWYEKLRCGWLWGFALSAQDLDKYCLYFFLTSFYGCDDMYAMYALFFFIDAFLLLGWQPISGWLTDRVETNQHVLS